MHYCSKYGGVAECRWNLPWTREVCSSDPEEVQDDGLHDHTYSIEPDASSETVDTTMYRQMIGFLMYLRPNICFAVNTLRQVHLMVAKHAGVILIMGSSTMQIRRLTWRVMLIQIE